MQTPVPEQLFLRATHTHAPLSFSLLHISIRNVRDPLIYFSIIRLLENLAFLLH